MCPALPSALCGLYNVNPSKPRPGKHHPHFYLPRKPQPGPLRSLRKWLAVPGFESQACCRRSPDAFHHDTRCPCTERGHPGTQLTPRRRQHLESHHTLLGLEFDFVEASH